MLHGLDDRTISIYAPVQAELRQVEEKLRNLANAEAPHMQPLLDYVTDAGGKRVRPAITLLASKIPGYLPRRNGQQAAVGETDEEGEFDPEKPVLMASAVELLHLATLIHDDTVDESPLRRGRATVGNVWGQHVAVLFGDYVFATSATFVCDTRNIRVVRRFSETIMELASGELLEFFNTFNYEKARELYKDRIYRKTASLFCTAAESGALLGGGDETQAQALRRYGYNIGMAFQIGDDLLDVQGDPTSLGKPVGADLIHGVLTLPTIMLLERYPDDNPVAALFQDPEQDGRLRQALEMINNSTIIGDCEGVVQDYCDQAIAELMPLPDNEARSSLLDLASYVRERRR